MKKLFPYITRPILVLSFVSLFTDMASEMLYPIMPVYLQSIGFSVLLIAVLEGFAEMIAGLSKGYFGQLSDVRQRRLPFVQLGYLLSAISKPMMALFIAPLWIFFARTTDRFGKGLRTAPRDALLSSLCEPVNKGKVFGFHRSMDTLGAVIGPLAALLYLQFYPEDYINLFLIAFLPGIVAVIFTLFLKEEKSPPQKKSIHFFSFLKYAVGTQTDPQYKKLLLGLTLFAVVNSSDVLLLLKMKDAGVSDSTVISIYIFYNLIFALSAFPAGSLADKFGLRNIYIFGLLIFSLVYAGFTFTTDTTIFWLLFLLYGFYAACTEGIAKAWIAKLVPATESATAIGTYAAIGSIGSLIASSLAGFLWYQFNAAIAFGFTTIVSVLLIFYFIMLKPERGSDAEHRQVQ